MPSRETQALLDAAVDAVVLIDHSGLITAFNRSAERLFGYSAEELLGSRVNTLMPEPYRSEHDRYLERYQRTGIPHIIGVGREVEALRKDGSCFPAFLSVGRVADSDPPRFVGFIRDVTTERQALATIQAERDRSEVRRAEERDARHLQERMTHVSRLATLGEMAAGIAHELNQPLSAIATYARACERFLESSAPDLPETLASLREIGDEALRAGDIIKRLRRLVSGRSGEHAAADLNEMIEDVAVLIQADARVHKAQVAFDLARELPRVDADRTQFQQMVLSLVRNALESLAGAPASGRQVTIRTALLPGRWIELSVSDNGPGVAPDMVDRLFMPFATTKATGTGLGLPISQTIAQAHGGTIGHRQASPHGACFFVRIPSIEDHA
jgi:two-component system, LuxR family, sensor kinase FixL